MIIVMGKEVNDPDSGMMGACIGEIRPDQCAMIQRDGYVHSKGYGNAQNDEIFMIFDG